MAVSTLVVTRQDLQRLDDKAWALYHDLCWCQEATDEDRQRAFDAALASTDMLLEHDRAQRGL